MKSSIGLILVAAGLAHGSTILLQSGVSVGEYNNITTNNVVLTDVEPEWTAPTGGADWISFENTGWSTITNSAVITVPNSTSQSNPTAEFFQTFTDTNSLLTLNITVWADDSAVVYLDGVQISGNASFNQVPGVYCSPTGITCDGPGTTFTVDNISPGTHTLEFATYQVGGGSFGLMYEGTVVDEGLQTTTPEPGSYLLFGAGLMGVAVLRLKRAF